MTYAQIEQIEDFIKQLDLLEQTVPDDCDAYANEIRNLNDQIGASVKGYDSDKIDFGKTYKIINYQNYSGAYDVKALKDVIKIMRSSLQAILNCDPIYPMICELRNDIKDSESVQDGDEIYYITEIVEKYSSVIRFSDAVSSLIQKQVDCKYLDENAVYSVFRGVVESLKFYLKNIYVAKEQNSKSADRQVTVVQNNNQSNYQNVGVAININIEDCLKDLDDCETLSEQELSDIKAQLDEIKQLLADKRGKKKAIKEKISSILKWVADKGTDVMIALLPTLITTLNMIK